MEITHEEFRRKVNHLQLCRKTCFLEGKKRFLPVVTLPALSPIKSPITCPIFHQLTFFLLVCMHGSKLFDAALPEGSPCYGCGAWLLILCHKFLARYNNVWDGKSSYIKWVDFKHNLLLPLPICTPAHGVFMLQ